MTIQVGEIRNNKNLRVFKIVERSHTNLYGIHYTSRNKIYTGTNNFPSIIRNLWQDHIGQWHMTKIHSQSVEGVLGQPGLYRKTLSLKTKNQTKSYHSHRYNSDTVSTVGTINIKSGCSFLPGICKLDLDLIHPTLQLENELATLEILYWNSIRSEISSITGGNNICTSSCHMPPLFESPRN